VHFSAITGGGYRSLEEGQKVELDITRGQKRLDCTARHTGQAQPPAAGHQDTGAPPPTPEIPSFMMSAGLPANGAMTALLNGAPKTPAAD
jgi:hypothetical protein